MRKSRSLTNFRRLWRFLSLKETKSSLVSLTYILKIINARQDNVKHGKNCTVSYASLCGVIKVIKLRSDSTSTWHDREGIKEREDGEKGGGGGAIIRGRRLFYSNAPSRVTSKFRQFRQRFKFPLPYVGVLVWSGKFKTKLKKSVESLEDLTDFHNVQTYRL